MENPVSPPYHGGGTRSKIKRKGPLDSEPPMAASLVDCDENDYLLKGDDESLVNSEENDYLLNGDDDYENDEFHDAKSQIKSDEEMQDCVNDDESLSEETEDDLTEQELNHNDMKNLTDHSPDNASDPSSCDEMSMSPTTEAINDVSQPQTTQVLGFDEYGNLTTIIQQPVQKLNGFDDEPINTKENIHTKQKDKRKSLQNKKISTTNLLNEVVNGDASPRSSRSKGKIEQSPEVSLSKAKIEQSPEVSLSKAKIEQSPEVSRSKAKIEQSPEGAAAQPEMQHAFKEFQAAPTSRYGRTRKRKADDDFYHGTINFNELRKIASNSSGSSSCSGSPKKIAPIKISPSKEENLPVSTIRDEPPMGCRLDKIWDDELSGVEREEESLGDFPSGTEEDYVQDKLEKNEVEKSDKQEKLDITSQDKKLTKEVEKKDEQEKLDIKSQDQKLTKEVEKKDEQEKLDIKSQDKKIINEVEKIDEQEKIDITSQDKQEKPNEKIQDATVENKEETIENTNDTGMQLHSVLEDTEVDEKKESTLDTLPVKEENDKDAESKMEVEAKTVSQESERIVENKSDENKSTQVNNNETNSDIERRSKKRKKSLKALRHSSTSIDNELDNVLEKKYRTSVYRGEENRKFDLGRSSNKSSKGQIDGNISRSLLVTKFDNKIRHRVEGASRLSLPEKASNNLEIYKLESSSKSSGANIESENQPKTLIKKPETSHMLDFVGAAQALRKRNIPIQELSSGESESSGEASLDSNNELRASRSGRLIQRRRSSISRSLKSKRNSWAGPASITDESQDEATSAASNTALIEQSTSKFGRHVKKPQVIDIVAEHKKQKEAQTKYREDMASQVVKHEGMLNKEELRVLEKMHPCTYVVGDLVWVNMRGSPLWPAMLAYSQTEGTYTRISLKQNWSKVNGHREYHVQFFNDNSRTFWIHPLNVLPFEGYDELLKYLNHLRHDLRSMIKNKKSHAESFIKTLNHAKKVQLGVKHDRWMQAIRDAQAALPCDRNERIRRYTTGYNSDPIIQVERPINNVLSKLSAAKKVQRRQSAPPAAMIKKKRGRPFKYARPENKLITAAKSIGYSSQSTDGDFSGFESADDKKRIQKQFVNNNNNNGDFEVYLEKHLNLYCKDNPRVSRKDAKHNLHLEWSKLSKQKRVAYRSRSNEDVKRKYRSDSPTLDDHDTPGKAKKKKIEDDDDEDLKGTYKVVRNEKVCFICEGVSECPQNKGTDMLKCKGLCCGVFHLNCVGLRGAPTKDFKCQDCSQRRHVCFVCKSSEGTTQRCSVAACGKFYHIECTEAWPLVCRQRNTERLVCPRHFCHMCAASADDMNDSSARTPPFTRCLRCPTTYHTGEDCIAAGVEEVSSNHHICTKHLQVPKSGSHHLNVSWCFCCSKGGNLVLCDQCPAAFHADCMKIEPTESKGYVCEDCDNGKFPLYGDIVWVKLGAYRWWPGQVLHPRFIPDNIENLSHKQGMFCVHFFGSNDYYWVSRGRAFLYQEGDKGSKNATSKTLEKKFGLALTEAADAFSELSTKKAKQETTRTQKGTLKPAPYVKIETNRPVGNVRLNKIDLSSVNHCDCSPISQHPCGDDSKCINRMLMFECLREVCPAGDKCQNQRFQRRQYPKIQSLKTNGRGWGLQGAQDIKKGEFVIEYVGDLIDDEEFRRRLDHAHDIKEENFYFLTIDKDIMIDAGPRGNLSRFMNHSCNPNCETQKWTVGGDTRVGLFAIQDIPAMSELTFNYNLECVGTDKKPCHCGGSQCSGFIGVKIAKNEPAGKGTKQKKKVKKRKRKVAKATDDECFRCSGTGDLILCDVTACPKGYHLSCLGLQVTPKGKWICPWHHCDECGGKALLRCTLCPNSFCRKHNRLEQHPEFGPICSDHNDDESDQSDSNQPSEDTSRGGTMTTNTTVVTEKLNYSLTGPYPQIPKNKVHGTAPAAMDQQTSVLSPLRKVLTPKSDNQRSIKKKRLSISKEGRENDSATLNVIELKKAVQRSRKSIGTKEGVQEVKMDNVNNKTGESKKNGNRKSSPIVMKN